MFYNAKIHWMEPKEGTDQMQRVTKQFLVYALSVTECEMRIVEWFPDNYQDAVVEEVKQTKILNLHTDISASTHWLVKMIDDNMDRAKPEFIVMNALNLEEVVKKMKLQYPIQDIEMIQKFKPVIDSDLVSEELPTKTI